MGQLPPHDLDAERVVIANLLLEPERMEAIDGLRPGHCFDDRNRLLLAAIQSLAAENRPVDAPAVRGLLADRGELDQAGGVQYLAELVGDDDPTVWVHDLAAEAERVRIRAEARRLIQACDVVAAETRTGGDPTVSRRRLHELVGDPEPSIGALGSSLLEWSGANELAQEMEPRTWAVPGLQLGPGRPALVAAYAGTAKTIALQSMLLSYAAGEKVWGQFAVGPGGVARHFDYEQGPYACRRRYQRLAYGMDVDLREMDNDRLQCVSFPPLYLTDSRADQWERELDGAGLALIDSFRAATPGIDENAAEIRQYVDVLTRVSERTGCSVVIIHHAGKAKDAHQQDPRQVARGSSALFDAVGCAFLIEMTTMDEPRRLRQTKLPAESDGSQVDEGCLVIEDVDGPTGTRHGLRITYQDQSAMPSGGPERTLSECELRIVRAVGGQPRGVSKRRLRALVTGSRAVFEAALEGVVNNGQIERVRAVGSAGGGGFVYRIRA